MAGVKIPDYGMFTKEGNRQVYHLVKAAKALGVSWERMREYLNELADAEGGKYGEARDTVVREAVYDEFVD